jgi:hypothetical protein
VTSGPIANQHRVLDCNSTGPAMPATFAGLGVYTIPNCNPARTINPYPGALCTHTSNNQNVAPTELTATCSVWIRATATDPVTSRVLTRLYRINIRR